MWATRHKPSPIIVERPVNVYTRSGGSNVMVFTMPMKATAGTNSHFSFNDCHFISEQDAVSVNTP